MQGYLWKRGHALPTMSRRYCVLDGSMLAVYQTEREHELGLTPSSVYEIREVVPWDGHTRLKKYEHGFVVSTLGGKTYQCSADTMAAQEQWIAAIQESLAEPYRIVADEIVEAQKLLQDDIELEHETADAAAIAVRKAEVSSKAIRAHEEQIQSLKTQISEIETQMASAQAEASTAAISAADAKRAATTAKQVAHHVMMQVNTAENASPTAVQDATAEASKCSALSEVAATLAATAQMAVKDLVKSKAALVEAMHKATEALQSLKAEAEANISVASGALQTAHSAKARTRLRVASWSSSPSHVDALAQGYLFCKHAMRPTMHSKYFVLYGKTLCWYKNADDFIQNANTPLGVVHVAGGVNEWSGRVGLTTASHPFSIPTVEGKTLHCSAPVSHDVAMWNTAFLIGMTMNPLSPERARAAKSRRDSFDLTSPPRAGKQRVSFFAADSSSPLDTSPHPVVVETEAATVEGYLVKQGHFVPTMKQKYVVLRGNHLFFYASYDAYMAKTTADVGCSQVASVGDWDGHTLLLTYPHPFRIETVAHAQVLCSAPTASEKDKWMRGLRAAIAKHAIGAKTSTSSDVVLDPAVQALQTLLSSYYNEHNPTKHDDIPTLLKLFDGRESQLLSHLDATYGTTLVRDHADLLATLEARHERLAARAAEFAIVPDAGVPHLEGVADVIVPSALGSSGKAEVYLVLLGHQLMQFASRTAALTAPETPTSVVDVCEASAGVSAADLTVLDTVGTKHLYHLHLEASRDHWLHMLSLGVDHARTHGRMAITLSDHKTVLREIVPGAIDDTSPTVEATAFKSALVAFYNEHNPDGLSSVDALLVYFRGQEHLLLESLDAMYGSSLASDPTLQALCIELTGVSSAIDRRGGSFWRKSLLPDGSLPALRKKAGYVKVKAPPSIPKLKRAFAVLNDDGHLAFFVDAMQDVALMASAPVRSVRVGDGQFSLYVDNTFLQCETEMDAHAWLSACHVTIASQHVHALTASPLAQFLVDYYRAHNPAKVHEVPLLLDSFAGRERELLVKLDAVYHTNVTSDAHALSLLPASSSSDASPSTTELVRGYFLMKGYHLPSLTRFYGVLRGNTLAVFDTEDDAAQDDNPTTKYDRKRVAAVVAWSGSTHAEYSFGLEIITDEHKTFFCAFATEDDQLHWASALRHGIAIARIEHRSATGVLASEGTQALRRLVLQRFGHMHMSLADDLDALLEYAHGFDMDLLTQMDRKYGTEMALDEDIVSLLGTLPPNATLLEPLKGMEGPLSLVTAEGQVKSQIYGVLDGTLLQCYASRESYKTCVTPPTLSLAIATIGPFEMTGFVMDTQAEGMVVYMRAASSDDQSRWLDAIQCALDKAALDSLFHAIPTDTAGVFSSFVFVHDPVAHGKEGLKRLMLKTKPKRPVKRYVVLDGLEFKVYLAPSDVEPHQRLAVASLCRWDESPNGFLVHCLDHARKPCDVYCSVESPELQTKWLDHYASVQKQQLGDALLDDQAYEVAHTTASAFDTSPMKGYMMYEPKASRAERREGFFLVHETHLWAFNSELSARSGDAPALDLEMAMLLEHDADSNDFYIEARLNGALKPLRFITADRNDRNAWVRALSSVLQTARGLALLQTTQQLLHESLTPSQAIAEANRATFVVSGSSMEGMLTQVQTAYWLFSHDEPRYFVLKQASLWSFASSAEAKHLHANNHSNNNEAETSVQMHVTSVSDWVLPPGSAQHGFHVHYHLGESSESLLAQLMAPSLEEKERWVRAIKEAQEDSLREAYYNDLLAHETELQAAAPIVLAYEGFVKTRKTRLTSPWREHYCVLKGPWLLLFASHDACLEAPDKPLEKHEIVLVSDWHGSLSLAVRHVFRVETLDDGFLEVSVGTDGEKVKWMKTLEAAVAAVPAHDVVSRNAALSSYPGASMEGYLIKKGHGLRVAKKRYCVLLSTEWLYFNSQEDALAQAQPLGVLKVLGAKPMAADTTTYIDFNSTVPEHTFVLDVQGHKSVLCEAHNSAEQHLWVEHIAAELEKEASLTRGLQASKESAQKKAEAMKAAVATIGAAQAHASAEMALTDDLLKKFQEEEDDGSSDNDDSDGATLYVEYVDTNGGFAPEDSPMRRTSKNKLAQHFPNDKTLSKSMASRPFWQLFCSCLFRPPSTPTLHQDDPLLTDDEKRLYKVQFYANGAIDSSF
ncbi:hypothetical protein SPRG_02939 [Saprolegnia parasitica CBS 223.65]|uniref:PH domain-containing protein n=1 Tax=Saprolegnia parasitica (strain CBS 223.65) TaxID=695850 RepID=A0A067D082_SAPPC|nr:hypothetical protein SPRG_02939 [Saprolegnia parasitica CBS 223.65]KDO32462.1 hypothetical protein SPRG_02939 [Saprolegnia parasitica CBS 223.65]|eukprot:XP_012196913.1 hypothetical protein SPRG_02939 [Saprolegnia parasitica CBS 223.65]